MKTSRTIASVMSCLLWLGCGPQVDDQAAPSNNVISARASLAAPPVPLRSAALTTVKNGRWAAVADPDGDQVILADLVDLRVVGPVHTGQGTQPSRVIEAGSDGFKVLLRGTGELATVPYNTLKVGARQSVCAEPRGLAFDARTNDTLVACASGELVKVSATGVVSSRFVRPDLRDVVISGSKVWLTTFRSAEIIDADTGTSLTQPKPLMAGNGATTVTTLPRQFSPAVAWRAVSDGNGGLFVVHQYHADGEIVTPHATVPDAGAPTGSTGTTPTTAGAYGGARNAPCETSVVRSALTWVSPTGVTRTTVFGGVLPIDLALSPDGQRAAIPTPGNLGSVVLRAATPMSTFGQVAPIANCTPPASPAPILPTIAGPTPVVPETIAVTYLPDNRLVTLSRNPLTLSVERTCRTANTVCGADRIEVGTEVVDSGGHDLFHVAPTGVACASCHPEAGDDGHTWLVQGKPRRTMNLSGGLMSTKPFHWPGDLADMSSVLKDTFVGRMGGLLPKQFDDTLLERFLNAVPAVRLAASNDPAQLERGHALFESTGCAGCHAGKELTTPQSVDVGTGETLQVPSLRGVGTRAPYMHTGCAKTLEERFTNPACGGSRHGNLDGLTEGDLSDLTAYVKSL